MDEQAFLALSHSAPEDAPIWLALRRATAECCRVSEAVIYPTDDLACLRLIMVHGSDANWLNLTPNWLDVMVRTELSLGISLVSCQLDKVWSKAEANGELGSLTQLAQMIIRFFRDRGEWPTSKRLEQ